MKKGKDKKIAIVTVPFITSLKHADLAQESLTHFKSTNHHLFKIGVVNRITSGYRDRVLPMYDKLIFNDKNILARAWNKGIDFAIKNEFDYILVPNLDVVSRHDTIDKLVELAEEFPEALMWCATEHQDRMTLKKVDVKHNPTLSLESHSFSYFMIDKRLFQEVGKFFEGYIPAYFEDWDMRDRIFASGNYIIRGEHILYYHYENGTRKNDRRIAMQVKANFYENEKIYLKRKAKLLESIT